MSRNIVIAFSGFKQSGKTTVTGMVENILAEDFKYGSQIGSITTESFADPFKRIIEDVFGVKECDVSDKETPIQSTKKFFRNKPKSYRELCISIGDGMKDTLKCPNLWCNTIERHINEKFKENNPLDKVFIVPDVRYASELKMLDRLRKKGYEVYHFCIFRKEMMPEWIFSGLNICNAEEKQIILDSFEPTRSEYEWCASNPKFTALLTNDGTKKELEEQVRSMVIERIWK